MLVDGKYVGRTKPSIYRCGTKGASRDRDGVNSTGDGLQGSTGQASVGDRPRPNVVEQRAGIRRGVRNLAREKVLGECVVGEPVSGAHNCFSGTENIVGNA